MSEYRSPSAPSVSSDSSSRGPFVTLALSVDQNAAQDPANDFSNPHRPKSGSSVIDTSSVKEFGRMYHSYKEGQYFLPNDSEEQERLDLLHAAVNILLDGRLHVSPIFNPTNILDIGTGTGIWAILMAKQYPAANVIGTDLSAIQPADAAPPNCQFIKEDAENDDWTFGDVKFSFIFWRHMVTCFSDWERVFDKAVAQLAPGGWIELHETLFSIESADGSTAGSAIDRWSKVMGAGLRRAGRDITVARRYKRYLEARGLTVYESIQPLPIGGWPGDMKYKRAGVFTAEVLSRGLEGAVKILLGGGLSPEEVRQLAADVRAEMNGHEVHAVYPMYFVWAQKPHH